MSSRRLLAGFLLVIGWGQAVPVVALANDYAPEINALRERERAMVEAGERELYQLNRYAIAWRQVEQAMKLLGSPEALSDRPAPSMLAGLSDSRSKLVQIARERAQVELALNHLADHRSAIESALVAVDQTARAFSDHAGLVREHELAVRGIRQDLAAYEAALRTRKAEADQQAQRWIEWEVQAFHQAIADSRREHLSMLLFEGSVSQVKTAVIRAKDAVSRAFEGSDLETAGELIDGITWIRSLVPAFLAGQLTTPERARTLAELEEWIESVEKQLTSRLEERRSAEAMAPGKLERSDNLDDLLNPKPFCETPPPFPEPSLRHREVELPGVGSLLAVDSVDYEKQIRSSASIEFPGYVIVDPVHPPRMVRVQKSERVSKDTRAAARERLKASLVASKPNAEPAPGPSEPIPVDPLDAPIPELRELRESHASLRQAIDEARAHPANPGERAGLEVFAQDLERIERQRAYFEVETRRGVDAARSSCGDSRTLAFDLRGHGSRSRVTHLLPEPPPPGQGADRVAAELGLMIADVVLSGAPLVGNAYNFGSFASAVMTDLTLLGQPAETLTAKTLLAVGVIAPFVRPAFSLTKIFAKARAILKLNRKAHSIPSAVPLGRQGERYAGELAGIDPILLRESFENAQATQYVLEPGTRLVRVSSRQENPPGRWYTVLMPGSRDEARVTLYLGQNNTAEYVTIYEVTERVRAYGGGIRNGSGFQYYFTKDRFPDEEELLNVLQKIETRTLN